MQKEEGKGSGERARLTLLWQDIQKSFGTTQAAVVCVGARIHACMHMCVS